MRELLLEFLVELLHGLEVAIRTFELNLGHFENAPRNLHCNHLAAQRRFLAQLKGESRRDRLNYHSREVDQALFGGLVAFQGENALLEVLGVLALCGLLVLQQLAKLCLQPLRFVGDELEQHVEGVLGVDGFLFEHLCYFGQARPNRIDFGALLPYLGLEVLDLLERLLQAAVRILNLRLQRVDHLYEMYALLQQFAVLLLRFPKLRFRLSGLLGGRLVLRTASGAIWFLQQADLSELLVNDGLKAFGKRAGASLL